LRGAESAVPSGSWMRAGSESGFCTRQGCWTAPAERGISPPRRAPQLPKRSASSHLSCDVAPYVDDPCPAESDSHHEHRALHPARRLLRIALLLVSAAFAATTAHAQVAYTDSLGREWRQVVGSTSRSWNEFASACPTDGVTPCNGLAGGLDVTGWIWATDAQVTELFAEFVPEILTNPSFGGPTLRVARHGFHGHVPADLRVLHDVRRLQLRLTGWTATQVGALARTASVSARWNPFDSSWDVAALAAVAEANTYRGAWMFRTGPATEPLTYCAPSAPGTSSGCLPQISATGHPDAAHSNVCVLTATGVEGQRSGTIFYGISGALQI
jgi:hypothetical protein